MDPHALQLQQQQQQERQPQQQQQRRHQPKQRQRQRQKQQPLQGRQGALPVVSDPAALTAAAQQAALAPQAISAAAAVAAARQQKQQVAALAAARGVAASQGAAATALQAWQEQKQQPLVAAAKLPVAKQRKVADLLESLFAGHFALRADMRTFFPAWRLLCNCSAIRTATQKRCRVADLPWSCACRPRRGGLAPHCGARTAAACCWQHRQVRTAALDSSAKHNSCAWRAAVSSPTGNEDHPVEFKN